jgi:signal transduction histidine kinase
MQSINTESLQFNMKTHILLLTLLITPFILLSQTYQQDTSTINKLLYTAKKKRFSDSATAIREVHQALALAQKHKDGYWMYECYHRLGRIHEVNNQDQKAHIYFVKELDYENQLDDSTRSIMYSEVSRSYQNIGDFRKAYEIMKKIEDLGIRLNNLDIQQTGNDRLGKFYTDINDFERATQYLMKSIEQATILNYPDEVCDGYRILATVYVKAKNYDLALDCAEKSISYVDKLDDFLFPRYYVYVSYGKILKDCRKYGEAITIYKKAAHLALEAKDNATLGNIYNLLGDLYTDQKDFARAEDYFKKCSTLLSETSDSEVMSYNLNYGKFLVKTGEHEKAIAPLLKSVSIALRLDNKIVLEKNYKQLSEAFERINDHKQSLLYIKKALVLKDSIYSEENIKRIAEAQFKFDLAKSEENLKKSETRQYYIVAIGLLIIVFLPFPFLIYFLRVKNQKNKLLLEKTQMLTDATRTIKDKNRKLQESNEILKQFANASAHDLKEPLRNINSFVNILQKRYVKNLPAEANEYMGFVTTGVKRMENLLNALLEYSSVLSNEQYEKKQNEFPAALKIVLDNLQERINEKKAIVRGPSVFPTIFMGEAHLKLLLSNILGNALKFSKMNAKIEVDFRITDTEFILSIRDEGIGLDKSYEDKIFKLFQRLNRVTHKESAGIGLTICKNIMDKYAGRIWFDSAINEWTTFYLAFPKSMIDNVPTVKQPLLIQSRYDKTKNSILETDSLEF